MYQSTMEVKCKNEAEKRIQTVLDQLAELDSNSEPMLVSRSLTSERSWGWVIHYQSKKYIETGEVRYQIAGNGPYFVNRNTGEMLYTGTALSIEKYIEEYEEQLRNDT